MSFDGQYDLAVVGGGPGGYTAALLAARSGLNVLLVEQDRLGGTCLNRGCIPTKSLLWEAKVLDRVHRSQVFVGGGRLRVRLDKLLEKKDRAVQGLVDGLGRLLNHAGVRILKGRAHLLSPQTIRVSSEDGVVQEHRCSRILLATGSCPSYPSSLEPDGQVIVTSDEALCLRRIPETLAIIGGGVVGVEFAYLFQALGTRVTILEVLPDILHSEDEDLRRAFRRSLDQRAVEIHLGAKVEGAWREGGVARVVFVDGNGRTEERKVDMVLLATGRRPSLQGIEPSRLGLAMSGPYVRVNRRMETNLHGVYAVGDLVGGLMTAHAASAQAEVAVANLLGRNREFDPHKVPRCVWGFPEAAAVGRTEGEAREVGRRVRVARFPYEFSGKAQAIGEVEGFVKIIGDEDTGEILGVHIFGENATELVGEFLLAMNIEAAVEDLGRVVKPHPTLSECVREAALAWEGRPLHMIPEGR